MNIYKTLVKLRNENEVIQKGDFDMITLSDWVFSFKRFVPTEEVPRLNFGRFYFLSSRKRGTGVRKAYENRIETTGVIYSGDLFG